MVPIKTKNKNEIKYGRDEGAAQIDRFHRWTAQALCSSSDPQNCEDTKEERNEYIAFFSTFIIRGKLAHTFSGKTSIRNYQIVLFVGETIVYREFPF